MDKCQKYVNLYVILNLNLSIWCFYLVHKTSLNDLLTLELLEFLEFDNLDVSFFLTQISHTAWYMSHMDKFEGTFYGTFWSMKAQCHLCNCMETSDQYIKIVPIVFHRRK